MSEKKKYTYDIGGAIRTTKKELVAYANSELNAKYLCKLLNKQEEEIQRLKARNEELIRIVHKIRETDIKLWENG